MPAARSALSFPTHRLVTLAPKGRSPPRATSTDTLSEAPVTLGDDPGSQHRRRFPSHTQSLRRLPSVRTRTRLITTLKNNPTVTARTCSVGVPPTPSAGLPRWAPDEHTTRGAHHPAPHRSARHRHAPPPLRPCHSREFPAPTPVLPRAGLPGLPRLRAGPLRVGLPDPTRLRAGLPGLTRLRVGLPDPTRLRADLPPHIPVGPLPQAVVPR